MATSRISIPLLSWNINRGVLNKLALLEKIIEKYDIAFIHGYFSLPGCKNTLQISRSNFTLIYPASLPKLNGRPSGGLAALSKHKFECLLSEDHFSCRYLHYCKCFKCLFTH